MKFSSELLNYKERAAAHPIGVEIERVIWSNALERRI